MTGHFRLIKYLLLDGKKTTVNFFYITDEGKPYIGGTPRSKEHVAWKLFYLQAQATEEERLTRSQARTKRARHWDDIDTALLEFHSLPNVQVRVKEVVPVPAYEFPKYWDSKEAKTLFCPKHDETVEDALTRRCKALDKVINEPDGYKSILPGDGDPDNLYTLREKSIILQKAMHMRYAYNLALDKLDSSVSWGMCCEEAAATLAKAGLHLGCMNSVMLWNRQYRKEDTLPHFNRLGKINKERGSMC
jgi:hypothetical protein